MSYTIEDWLNALKNNDNKNIKQFNIDEIWAMTAIRESWEKMGFSSEAEYKQYLKDNPYSNI